MPSQNFKDVAAKLKKKTGSLPVCTMYAKGDCPFGPNCPFAHPPSGGNFGQQTYYERDDVDNDDDVDYSEVLQNAFFAEDLLLGNSPNV